MLRAIWSPGICLITKKVNKFNIYDQKIYIYERCFTFDGPEIYSDTTPATGKYPLLIRKALDTVTHHIRRISDNTS